MKAVRKRKHAIAEIESQLLKRVRAKEGLSRVELARAMRLAPSTVGIYVDRLIEDGLLLEGQKVDSDAGRPPTVLQLNPGGGQFIGVDFEAHAIRAIAIDFSNRPIAQVRRAIRVTDTPSRICAKISDAIESVHTPNAGKLLGIGVGVPGLIDPEQGIAIRYQHLQDWKNIPLAAQLRERFGVPVYLENNIRSMALSELWFGGGRKVEDFICLGIRSGIAAGIVLNRQLLRGAGNTAGEIGGWSLSRKGAASGTLEELASTAAIVGFVRSQMEAGQKTSLADGAKDAAELTIEDVIAAAARGDAISHRAIEGAGTHLGQVCATLVLFFNPQRIILAGPMVAAGKVLLEPLRSAAGQGLAHSPVDAPEIVFSELGEYSGALGAAALVLHEWQPVR